MKKKKLEDFFKLKAKEIFENFEEPRKEGGLITQKQIAYVYVLAREYDIDKNALEDLEFRKFSSSQARELIDSIKDGTFESKYLGLENLNIIEYDDDDLLF